MYIVRNNCFRELSNTLFNKCLSDSRFFRLIEFSLNKNPSRFKRICFHFKWNGGPIKQKNVLNMLYSWWVCSFCCLWFYVFWHVFSTDDVLELTGIIFCIFCEKWYLRINSCYILNVSLKKKSLLFLMTQFDKTQYPENRIKLPVYVPGSYIQVMKYLNCHFDILLW